MKLSILPIFVVFAFVFCIGITRQARSNESIKAAEAHSVYALLLTFFAWSLVLWAIAVLAEDPTSFRPGDRAPAQTM